MIWSTVALNAWFPSSIIRKLEKLADMLPGVEVPDRDRVGKLFELDARWKIWLERGLARSALELMGVPGVEMGLLPLGRSVRGRMASEAARRRRLVVPAVFEVPDLAEQTTTTRFPASR